MRHLIVEILIIYLRSLYDNSIICVEHFCSTLDKLIPYLRFITIVEPLYLPSFFDFSRSSLGRVVISYPSTPSFFHKMLYIPNW